MKRFPLDKRHKLCSLTDIDSLFANRSASSAIAYPLRAVWQPNPERKPTDARVKILISVPKKRLRHAVDRVRIRRLVREAYRLNRLEFESSSPLSLDNPQQSADSSGGIDLAFIFVADKVVDYAAIEKSMKRLLTKIHRSEP